VEFAGTTKAVLTATISVDCTSQSVPGAASQTVNTTTITTINIDVSPNTHLGDWLSPTSLNNTVVGMSYDVIGAHAYLTIGVGLTPQYLDDNGHLPDPLPSVIADTNYNLNVDSLGINADTQWGDGLQLYKINSPAWQRDDPNTGFLHQYGVWFFPDGIYPYGGRLLGRKWTLTVPRDGTYTYHLAADFLAFFGVDGVIYGDTRQAGNVAEAQKGFQGTITLAQGLHVLQINSANVYQDRTVQVGFALTIADNNNQIIWSTLKPIRSTETYPGWSEVYRIPLVSASTGNPATYYSGNYLIKNTGPVEGQYCWQDFFGDYTAGSAGGNSIFVVNDDGYGNLSITTQYKTIAAGVESYDQTLDQLQYIAYYYDTLDFSSPYAQKYQNHSRRIHQLDPGPQGNGHQCNMFVGFDSNGTVVTMLTRYPGDNGYDPIPRYLVGTFHVDVVNGNPDPEVEDIFKRLLRNPLVWIAGLTIVGLYTGGLAYAIIQLGFIAGGTQTAVGTYLVGQGVWLQTTFGAGAAAEEGATTLGGVFAGDTPILTYLAEAVPFLAAALVVYLYGGQIYNFVYNIFGGGVVGSVAGVAAVAGVAYGTYLLTELLIAAVCFTEETLIDMADGTQKPIIDVKEGDLVWNHDKTQVNEVTFWEYDHNDKFGWLYSPKDDIRPFATINHPLIIDGEMYATDPKMNYEIYPWLGLSRQLENFHIGPLEGRCVYSLWVTGDSTFRVNGYGTHSIFGDGGGLLDCYRRGYLSKEEVLDIRRKFTEQGPDAIYGGYLYNNWLAKADIKFLTNLSADAFREGSNATLEKASMYLTKQLGKIARPRIGKE
jgi:hypothetical protein